MMATQELVVPKSIPITSPASLDFHLLPTKALAAEAPKDEFLKAAEVVSDVCAAVLRRRLELAAESMVQLSEKDVDASEGGFSPSAVEKQKHHG